MGEPTEDLFLADPVVGEVDRFRWVGAGLGRGELAEGTMWPGSVVMPQVFGQHPAQMVLTSRRANIIRQPSRRRASR